MSHNIEEILENLVTANNSLSSPIITGFNNAKLLIMDEKNDRHTT